MCGRKAERDGGTLEIFKNHKPGAIGARASISRHLLNGSRASRGRPANARIPRTRIDDAFHACDRGPQVCVVRATCVPEEKKAHRAVDWVNSGGSLMG